MTSKSFGHTFTRALLEGGIAIACAGLFGCSSNDRTTSPNTPPAEGSVDLNDTTGGFDFADETPAFGDASLEQSAQVEESVDDPVSDQLGSAIGDRQAWALTATWGVLRHDNTDAAGRLAEPDPDRTDWTGSMSMNAGTILLRRTIAFEPGDHVVIPRADPSILEWVSHTGDGFDGLRVTLIHAAGGPQGDAPTWTFRTPLYEHTFTEAELDSLDLLVDLNDAAGNQIHFRSYRITSADQVGGFLAGSWNHAAGDVLGHLGGRLVNQNGEVVAFLRGGFGVDRAGEHVLVAKVIDRQGHFRAVLRGSWQAGNSTQFADKGSFRGQFLAGTRANPTVIGTARGQWVSGGDRRRAFDGVWCFGCQ